MIVFVHLLNDCSGSPRILQSAIYALSEENDRSRLFIGSDGKGCLDDVDVEITRYWYRRMPKRLLTLATYMLSQFGLFIRLLSERGIEANSLIYINTLLPFGAAIYGKLTGRPVIYHLHEVSVTPKPLMRFLTSIARHTAQRLIYVSEFHRDSLPISNVTAITVYNALSKSFLNKARGSLYKHRRDECFNVLMLASSRDYKGVPEFVNLVSYFTDRQDMHFDLVLNDSDEAIDRYFSSLELPKNITIHSQTDDPENHYAKASLVMNLSRPDQWVETFGMTILEAMAFGIPVIAPPIGGPVEVVCDGEEGFLVDCRDGGELANKVSMLADDEQLCLRVSAAARKKAEIFSPDAFKRNLQEIVEAVRAENKGS